jgi:hypothetical protein
MEDIDVNWRILSSIENVIQVEYSHVDVRPIVLNIPLYGDDINNVEPIIQARGPYQYFYNALHPAVPGDVSALVGETGIAVLKTT